MESADDCRKQKKFSTMRKNRMSSHTLQWLQLTLKMDMIKKQLNSFIKKVSRLIKLLSSLLLVVVLIQLSWVLYFFFFEAVVVDSAGEGVGIVAAWGQYHDLVGIVGGEQIPAVWISIGVERIFSILEAKKTKREIITNIGSCCFKRWSTSTFERHDEHS